MNRRILQMELRKACRNRWFFISLASGSFLALCGAYLMVSGYFYRTGLWELMKDNSGAWIKNPHIGMETLFNSWIGGEIGTWSSNTFFFLFPILAVLPYGWSLCTELRSGYIKNMITRANRRDYLTAKYLAAFIAGGIAVVLPMLINFLIVACFIPMRMPRPSESMYYGVFGGSMWSEIFYTAPIIYVLLYLVLDFVFAGLWATVSLSIAYFVKNKGSAMIAPYLFLLFFHFVASVLFVWDLRIDVTPINFVRATEMTYPSNIFIILAEFAVLTVFGLLMIRRGESRDVL
ncbi:MAG: hypothetical protein RSC76_01275 [Oscillospiraceae bacterium]